MDATIQNGIALNPKSILTKVDTTPTADSNNPVSSDGVKTYVDQKDQATNIRVDTLNTQIAASFFFKGSSTFAELPASGNTVNDTYYVTDSDKECWYSWNGTDWIKSSMSQADYAGLIAQLKADVSAEYSTSKTYKVGDYCLYGADGVLYICKIAVTTAGAFDSNKWQAISFGEAVGDLVIADDTQPTSLANKIWLDTDPNPDTVEVITEEDLGNIVAGEFDSVSAYAVGDYCIHDAKLYVAKTATAANDGWIAARWQQVTVMGTINDQVGELKTHFVFGHGKNYLNTETSVDGYLNANGTIHENAPSTDWKTSDFIDVSDAEKLVFSSGYPTRSALNIYYLLNYNSEKTVTGTTYIGSIITQPYVVPDNVKYIRFSYHDATVKPMLESGTSISDYEAYKVVPYLVNSPYPTNQEVDALVSANETVVENATKISDIEDLFVTQEVKSKNLFNPNAADVAEGKYLDTSGNYVTDASWNVSGYIDVSELSSVVASIWQSNGAYYTYGKLQLMHSYNAQKQHIAKVWDSSPDGTYSVGENVAYIRFCWKPNGETQDGRKYMVESGTTHSLSYEEYFEPYVSTTLKPTSYGDNSISEEKLNAELQNKLDAIIPSEEDAVSCWGDSLTYSQYSTSVKYPARLATLTDKTVYNWGMPGANSMDISGLQGSMPIYLDPFTLPADTSSVTVTLKDANGESDYVGLLHHMPRAGWVNDIQAMNNYWMVGGVPVMLVWDSQNYKVYRLTAGTESVVFDRPVKLTSIQDYAKEQIQIFWVGTNDTPSTEAVAERTVRIIKNMVDFYGWNRYLVLGLTVKAYADAINALLAQTFGNNYVDVYKYLLTYGLDDNNITPTAQDTTDIAAGIVPDSLRYDSVHFNDYGYTAVANCVYQHGKDLGYWN